MNLKAHIIGNHPIIDNIVSQYRSAGYDVLRTDSIASADLSVDAGEYFIALENNGSDISQLSYMEGHISGQGNQAGQRPVCHLMIHDPSLLFLFRTEAIFPELNRRFELNVFTMEDQWAINLLCNSFEGLHYPHLDRHPVFIDSNSVVHLVIDGFDKMGQALAINAALVCHFPNYVRDKSLRTRITCIDRNMAKIRDSFIASHIHLMDNSYYRFIDVSEEPMQTYFHKPMYEGLREDFVDVEWEFVSGDIESAPVRDKISFWASDKSRQMTLALCSASDDDNLRKVLDVTALLEESDVPVWVYAADCTIVDSLKHLGGKYARLYPFGMSNCGYSVSQTVLRMAKLLNYFYDYNFSKKELPTSMPLEEVEASWQAIEMVSHRFSNISNVMNIPYKMRSVGHDEEDDERFYALNAKEIALLAEVEHNRWSVERLVAGSRPVTPVERDEIRDAIEEFIRTGKGEDLKKSYKKRGIHYDLCAFSELGKDRTGRNVREYDIDLTTCIPLIVEESKRMR